MKAAIVTYVVKKGREAEFQKVLRRHWKVLQSENLTTDQLPFLLKDPESPTVYKEIFEWKSKTSIQKAQESKKVQEIWHKLIELTVEGGIEPAFFNRI